MINKLLMGIIKLIIRLVGVLLAPLDLLIQTFLPDLQGMFNAINGVFGIINNVIGWAVSATGLNTEVLSFLVLLYTFKLTVPLLAYSLKKAVRWYNAMKP